MCTHGCNQDWILETIEIHSHFGNLVKTHVDEDDTLKQGIIDNLGRKLNCQIDSAGQNRNVAEALRYINTSDAIATHVEDEDKMQIAFHDLKKYGLIGFGTKETQLINERADNAIRDHCKGVNETFIPTNGGKQLEKVIQKGQFTTLEIPNRGLPNLGNPKTQGHFNPEFWEKRDMANQRKRSLLINAN